MSDSKWGGIEELSEYLHGRTQAGIEAELRRRVEPVLEILERYQRMLDNSEKKELEKWRSK